MKLYIILICGLLSGCNIPSPLVTDFNIGQQIALKKKSKILIIFDNFGNPMGIVDKWLTNQTFQKALKSFVVIRLMCDDRRLMDTGQTIGDYNTKLQMSLTDTSYQPMICIFDSLGKKIAKPIGYNKIEDLVDYINQYH